MEVVLMKHIRTLLILFYIYLTKFSLYFHSLLTYIRHVKSVIINDSDKYSLKEKML
jgi:hypothetical protein